MKKAWKKRKWLNPSSHDDNGYIMYGQESDHDGFLKIADCHRVISMNLWFDTKAAKRQRIKKLKLMEDSIAELRMKLEAVEV